MVGVGSTPAWLSRALYAADAPSPRKKILVAIFQRGAVDGLNVVVPHGEKRYYEMRPTIAIPRPNGTPDTAIDLDGLFGLHPSLSALKPIYDAGQLADRRGGRLARPDALAFRRAGLYGIRHARPQGDRRRLVESGSAERIRQAIAGARDQHGSRTLPRALRGHNDAVAINNLDEFQVKDARSSIGLRKHVRQHRATRS